MAQVEKKIRESVFEVLLFNWMPMCSSSMAVTCWNVLEFAQLCQEPLLPILMSMNLFFVSF